MSRFVTTLAAVLVLGTAAVPSAIAGPTGSSTSTAAATTAKLDLNKATREQLVALPNVGPKVAERILSYREQNGGFRSVDELLQVKGIGGKTMDRLRELVVVAPAGDAKAQPASPAGK